MELSNCQKKAIDTFIEFLFDESNDTLVISGFAGTGKTALSQEIINNFKYYAETVKLLKGADAITLDLIVTATTNKAARVIADMTGEPPKTIHSLLGLTVQTDYKTGKTKVKKTSPEFVENALIMIDEASFIDSDLLELINKYTINCKFVFIGDKYQLSPIFDQSCPVFDITYANKAELLEPVRNPGIIEQTAGLYRKAVETGAFPIVNTDQQNVVYCTGLEFKQAIDANFCDESKIDSKILAWTNDRVQQYNQYCTELLGKSSYLHTGAKVITNTPISTKNANFATDSELEITKIYPETVRNIGNYPQSIIGNDVVLNNRTSIWVPRHDQPVRDLKKFLAKAKDWVSYFDVKKNWGDLRPIYASTVHKAQGSTYNKVFIDIEDICRCNIKEDVARMLYVAFSRPKTQVFIYGQMPKKYGEINVHNKQTINTG